MNNYTSSLKSVTTSETMLADADNTRSALIIFNQGEEPINWYFDSNSTVFFTLEAGKGMYFPEVPRNQINAVTASGTASVSVMEA